MFNAQKLGQPVKIHHPLVRDAYLKKEASTNNRGKDVLVIEARSDDEDMEFGGFDSYLYDLVTDLQNLKQQAEEQAGSIDRVDICTH